MLMIQLTGLSGSGKTTIANGVRKLLEQKDYQVEVIDGDIYRKILCPDLGFSKEDRNENIRRLGSVANLLAIHGVIAILATINPYEEIRRELRNYGLHVNTVWINCDIETLVKRDTKELYKKALLPDNHPGKIRNLSGINDPYELPQNANLVIQTNLKSEKESIETLYSFILNKIRD